MRGVGVSGETSFFKANGHLPNELYSALLVLLTDSAPENSYRRIGHAFPLKSGVIMQAREALNQCWTTQSSFKIIVLAASSII